MATLATTQRILVAKKDPPYPINVPVEVIMDNWRYSRRGLITEKMDPNSTSYWFNWENGRPSRYINGRYHMTERPLFQGTFKSIIVVETGEEWDTWIRA